MSDQPDEDAPAENPDSADSADQGESGPVSTGHPAVDEVLRSLDHLDGRPVDEHVAAFEEAHESLRRTLSGAADESGGEAPPPEG
jgi:hypothetical protein